MGQNIGVAILNPGGNFPAYNISAAKVIKGSPGILHRITVQTAPSAGNLTVNDCATTGAAAIGNQLLNIPFGQLTAGTVLYIEWPCDTGIVISSVGTGGVYAVAYD